eukprot:GHVN01100775.1.p1 GENE.GHVN01100775.1~~GHVN01100775.1.p1  ORF type:complete len:148 (+),score=9.57 GHVN01100775.1:2-445(+)
MNVEFSVPQGSILTSLLFIISVNDLSSVISSSLYQYLDDTKVVRPIRDNSDGNILLSDMISVHVASINLFKTFLLLFGRDDFQLVNQFQSINISIRVVKSEQRSRYRYHLLRVRPVLKYGISTWGLSNEEKFRKRFGVAARQNIKFY